MSHRFSVDEEFYDKLTPAERLQYLLTNSVRCPDTVSKLISTIGYDYDKVSYRTMGKAIYVVVIRTHKLAIGILVGKKPRELEDMINKQIGYIHIHFSKVDSTAEVDINLYTRITRKEKSKGRSNAPTTTNR